MKIYLILLAAGLLSPVLSQGDNVYSSSDPGLSGSRGFGDCGNSAALAMIGERGALLGRSASNPGSANGDGGTDVEGAQ